MLNFCPNCGTRLDPALGQNFCYNCGMRLAEVTPSGTAPTPPQPFTAPQPVPPSGNRESTVFCAICRHMIKPADLLMCHCGLALHRTCAKRHESCPNCGATIFDRTPPPAAPAPDQPPEEIDLSLAALDGAPEKKPEDDWRKSDEEIEAESSSMIKRDDFVEEMLNRTWCPMCGEEIIFNREKLAQRPFRMKCPKCQSYHVVR